MPDKLFYARGRVLKGVGGLFSVLIDSPDSVLCGRRIQFRARGTLRTDRLLPGDLVKVSYSPASLMADGTPAPDASGLPGGAIEEVQERKNAFIRPPMANLDRLFIVLASARPEPSALITDKLLSVCEYSSVEPVIVIGKSELSPETAARFYDIYTGAGYRVFTLSCLEKQGIDELREYMKNELPGTLSAFAGASGAGKTTLMNSLFPELELRSGEVSVKTGRGRHTTRAVEIYGADFGTGSCLIADTPGFSAIDFANFDFLPFEALADTMRDFLPYYKDCRWPDCSHTKEADCAVVQAVKAGKIAPSRHESYLEMYTLLKNKPKWD